MFILCFQNTLCQQERYRLFFSHFYKNYAQSRDKLNQIAHYICNILYKNLEVSAIILFS